MNAIEAMVQMMEDDLRRFSGEGVNLASDMPARPMKEIDARIREFLACRAGPRGLEDPALLQEISPQELERWRRCYG